VLGGSRRPEQGSRELARPTVATAPTGTVIRHLRRAVLRQDARTDGQLLASIIDHKDEAAFEALVRRQAIHLTLEVRPIAARSRWRVSR
jgi:hypothetical protein